MPLPFNKPPYKQKGQSKMKPKLIVMLTYNDQTVANAHDLFLKLANEPIVHWGFKDIGLSPKNMKTLVDEMKHAGKITYLEIVSLSEEEGCKGAQLALDIGFDVLMGTVYFPSIADVLVDSKMHYYPFVGEVSGHPSILSGEFNHIANHAMELEKLGVNGLDLLSYRHAGNARELLSRVTKAVDIPVISAGSIDSCKRIAEVWSTEAWGFTVGSAFFDQKFVPDGDFIENVKHLNNWLEDIAEERLAEYL